MDWRLVFRKPLIAAMVDDPIVFRAPDRATAEKMAHEGVPKALGEWAVEPAQRGRKERTVEMAKS